MGQDVNLHGAGLKYSNDWWRGLAGVLIAEGFILFKSNDVDYELGDEGFNASCSAHILTQKAQAFILSTPPTSFYPPDTSSAASFTLTRTLPTSMLALEERHPTAYDTRPVPT